MSDRQPSDPRVHRSRAALEAALRELITDRDLAELTVRDITARAGVNRSTFYEHYAGVDDLAVGACEAMFDGLIAAAPVVDGRNPHGDAAFAAGALAAIFSHIADHARLYRALVGEGGSARVINHMHRRLTVTVHVTMNLAGEGRPTHAADPTEIPRDSEAAFIAGALLGIILDWLRLGCPDDARRLSALIWPMLAGAAQSGCGDAQDRRDPEERVPAGEVGDQCGQWQAQGPANSE